MANAARRTGLPRLALCALALAPLSPVRAAADASSADLASQFPDDLRQKIKHVIIVYPENRSFDSLYGHFPGANGLDNASEENFLQRDRDGLPYPDLPQPRTDGIPGVSAGPDARFPASLPNRPYDVEAHVPRTERQGDLVHRFYTEQYQIADARSPLAGDPKHRVVTPLSRFAAFSDNPGLVLSSYDAQDTPEGRLGKEFVICDHAFHSAFGGSFLNHLWLIAARTPVWPAHPEEGSPPNPSAATVFDATGYPVLLSGGTLSDGVLTNDPRLPSFAESDAARDLGPGDYWAVNTVRPLRGPAGGLNALQPEPPGPGPVQPPAQPTADTPVGARLPLQTYATIGDRLDAAGVSWAWFSEGWDDAKAGRANYLFQFHHQPFAYFAKYALAKSPVPAQGGRLAVPGEESDGSRAHLKDYEHDFLTALDDGTLPAVCFVKPIGQHNAHPGYASVQEGAAWVAALVERVRHSPVWADCAVFVMYDEHGGLWDHVLPPVIDAWGPGLRVPLLVISPFAKRSFVDHTRYETVSLLAFLEGLYRMPPLNRRDRDALPPISGFADHPDLVLRGRVNRAFAETLPVYPRVKTFATEGTLGDLTLDEGAGNLTGLPLHPGVYDARLSFEGNAGKGTLSVRVIIEP